jgi:nucleoside-diphosphate kinase
MNRSNSTTLILLAAILCQSVLSTDFRRGFTCPMQLIRSMHLAPTVGTQQVIVIIKPDAVQKRDLTKVIRQRFTSQGFLLLKMHEKFLTNEAQLTKHYRDHVGKPYFPKIISTMTSGPISVYLFSRVNAIAKAAELVGDTDPKLAAKGTIRGDYGLNIDQNTVYSSYSPQAFEWEHPIWFPAK